MFRGVPSVAVPPAIAIRLHSELQSTAPPKKSWGKTRQNDTPNRVHTHNNVQRVSEKIEQKDRLPVVSLQQQKGGGTG